MLGHVVVTGMLAANAAPASAKARTTASRSTDTLRTVFTSLIYTILSFVRGP